MKKIILFIFFSVSLLSSTFLQAQSVGVSASALGFFFKDAATNGLGRTSSITPGFRIEANAIHVGDKPAMIGYLGLGYSYFFPRYDSTFFYGKLKTGNNVPVSSRIKTTTSQISIHYCYNIPQSFNDFITFHVGVGLSALLSKTQNTIPEKSATFNYSKSDFDESTFAFTKDQNFSIDFVAGAMYEFEKFSLTAQYNFMFYKNNYSKRCYVNGLMVGIYYPLVKFDQ